MSAMLSEAPEVKIARIGLNRFVDALRMFSANARVADVASTTGANEDDLRFFRKRSVKHVLPANLTYRFFSEIALPRFQGSRAS